MKKEELVTVEDLEERERRLKAFLLTEFEKLQKQIEELNKPYVYYPQNMSLKQAMEYTGRSKSCILAWVKDELLKPYSIGSSTSIYYSKTELDNLKPNWEGKKREKEVQNLNRAV